jgi:hypothetical protein
MGKYSDQFHNATRYSDDPMDSIEVPHKKKFPAFIAFLLLLVGGTYLVQTTLAANISLNSAAPVEFGQGLTQTVACSGASNVIITPSATFENASGGGANYLSSITVSDIPTNCYGKDFTIKAYGNTDSAPLALFNTTSTNAVAYNDGGTFTLGLGSDGMTIAQSAGTFTFTFTTPVALTSTVFKITVESSEHAVATYSLGSTGPGGGIIFYISTGTFTEAGATCGSSCKYLEYAPTGWYTPQADGAVYWSSDTSNFSGASGTALGTGFSNTTTMLTSSGSYVADTYGAAYISRQYAGNDSSAGQWFLPSKDELALIASSSAKSSGSFISSFYWSSTDANNLNAYGQNFSYSGGTNSKAANYYVRPIRAF